MGPASLRLGSFAVLVLAAALSCQPKDRVPRRDRAILAWESFPLSLDPRLGQDQASERLLALTHQGLVKRGPRLELLPDACRAWSWTRPYSELAFDFPRGIPFGAEDARKSIQALLDPALASPKAGPLKEEIAALRVEPLPDGERLIVTLKGNDPGFAANLGRGILGITRNGAGGAGSGPYEIASMVPEQRILLRAKPGHPDFAGHPGKPLDLDLRWMPDATTRLLALRHGSVDACPNNLPPDLLLHPSGFEAHRSPGANLEYVAFNCLHPALKDPRVRRALSLALDRPALVRGLLDGMGREATGFFPPEAPFGAEPLPASESGLSPAERLRLAGALLDEAGFRRDAAGLRFTLRMHATAEVASRMKALALKAQWAPLGVDLRILTREFGTLLGEVSAGRFDVASLRWVGIADPEMLYRTFHSSMTPPAGFNRGHYADPETDRLLEAARRSGDPAARFALLKEAQARIRFQAPYAFLWWPDQVVAAAPGLELELNPVGDFTGVWRR